MAPNGSGCRGGATPRTAGVFGILVGADYTTTSRMNSSPRRPDPVLPYSASWLRRRFPGLTPSIAATIAALAGIASKSEVL